MDGHRRDDAGRAEVGDIEGLDAVRKGLQLQGLLQPLKGFAPPLGGARPAQDLLPCVERGALDQAHPLAALRRLEGNAPPGVTAEQGLQFLRVLQLHRQEDGPGPAAALDAVVLAHQIGDRPGVVLEGLVHHLGVLAHQIAVHKKYLDAATAALLDQPMIELEPWDPMGTLAR